MGTYIHFYLAKTTTLGIRMINKLIAVTTLLFSAPHSMAIINIESMRMHSSNSENSFSLLLSMDKKQGNTNKNLYKASGEIKKTNSHMEHLALLSKLYEESQDIRTDDQTLIHYRWGYFIHQRKTFEVFSQWQQDHFKRIKARGLLGSGLRHNMFTSQTAQTNLGLGAFYAKEEHEDPLTRIEIEKVGRFNIYFSMLWNLDSNILFELVTYFQPKVNQLNDFHWFIDNQLELIVNKHLSFVVAYQMSQDNLPLSGLKKTDHIYSNSLKIKF
ncbi:MAG: DUF481 domain-containing protein [Bdellovibrionales bacterium]|nr:DUF481 domain-containing protein [Bdellovibrionales bacterium]